MNAARSAARHAAKAMDFTKGPLDREAYVAAAQELLRPGRPKLIFDYLSPTPSHLLNTSLAGLIPPEVHHPPSFRRQLLPSPDRTHLHPSFSSSPPASNIPLPTGHHLVYFAPPLQPADLLPDGTDASHWPGAPFNRRMWAGGSVRFPRPGGAWGPAQALVLDGRAAVCVETVAGPPAIRGAPGDEKVFVEVRRRYGRVSLPGAPSAGEGDGGAEDGRLRGIAEAVEREPDIDETRTLVFMRERGPETAAADQDDDAGREDASRRRRLRELKDRALAAAGGGGPPTYSFALVPDRALLFHFSALTLNAHAIHLDGAYARGVERHRALLVHGPLALALMLMAVRAQADVLAGAGDGGGARPSLGLAELSYRNLAPLYVGEEMRVCVRTRGEGSRAWDVWVEGPDGGFAVKGTAAMQVLPIS